MALSTAQPPYIELLYREKVPGTENFTHHRINFGEVASAFSQMGYGFGVERLDFTRKSRKNIQQTRGVFDLSGEIVPGTNFYVDTWWTAPSEIVLAGAIEMPSGKDTKVCYWDEQGKLGQRQMLSFLDCLEKFFEYNNNPVRVTKDSIWLLDFMKKQYYNVTLKSIDTNVSVDRPNLLIFQISVVVLEETSELVKSYSGIHSSIGQVFTTIEDSISSVTSVLTNPVGEIIGRLS